MHAWLAGSHLVTLVLPLAALIGTGAFAADLHSQTLQDAQHQGVIVAELAAQMMRVQGSREVGDIQSLLTPSLQAVKAQTLAGFQVVDRRGHVVARSGVSTADELGDSPEVQEALAGRIGVAVRNRGSKPLLPLSSESRRSGVQIFVAVPIELEGEVLGGVLVSRTPREEVQVLWQMLPSGLLLGALAAAGGAVSLALGAAGIVTRSLRGIAAESKEIAEGTVERARLEGPRGSRVGEVADVANAIRALVDRLQERTRYIAEFAGNVSHEFKTPLTTLRGTLELLEDEPEMAAEQRATFLTNAKAEVDRLERMMGGLLALARVDERREDGTQVDLDGVLQEVADRAQISFESGAGSIIGNRPQWVAVVHNLVENAIRHGAPPITVRGWRTAGKAGFEVEDAGLGISAANQALIFQRFFTTDRIHGTGLGLPLVVAVAEAQGGVVTVESAPGCTRFRVSVPSS